MITTIIFDLDGTLMNTLEDLHDSVCHALVQDGLPPINKADTRLYLGNGIKNLIWRSVEHVCPEACDEQKERVLNTFRNYYVEHSMVKTAPYDGIMPMLAECKRDGLHTAIVSNKLAPAVSDIHRAFFADTIEVAIGETPTVRRKPAPDMVEEALRQLSALHRRQIEKHECVYVGDSEVDLQTATNSGLPCIAVSWGFRDRDWLVKCGATTIVDNPSEILTALTTLQ